MNLEVVVSHISEHSLVSIILNGYNELVQLTYEV